MLDEAGTFRALLIVTPSTSLLAVAALIDCMRAANRVSGKELFVWRIATLDGAAVSASNGFTIASAMAIEPGDDLPLARNIFVLASYEQPQAITRALASFLRRTARSGSVLIGIDQGAVLLASAGLLDGYRATSHWEVIPSLVERFWQVEFVEQLYVVDRDRITCAGHLACVDLALHLVDHHYGRALAMAAASEIIYDRLRSGQQRQRVLAPEVTGAFSRPVRKAVTLMEAHLAEPISILALAAAVGLSPRQLESQFQAQLKSSPLRYYLSLRLAFARKLLLYSSMRMSEVSNACGFAAQASFTRSFTRAFKLTPTGYRRKFKTSFDRPYVLDLAPGEPLP